MTKKPSDLKGYDAFETPMDLINYIDEHRKTPRASTLGLHIALLAYLAGEVLTPEELDPEGFVSLHNITDLEDALVLARARVNAGKIPENWREDYWGQATATHH